MRTSLRGVSYPDAADDLIAAWRSMADGLGVITPVGDVAAARALIASLDAAGVPPTGARPLYLDIGAKLYRSTGAKSSTGAWVLEKIDEVEVDEKTYANSWSGSLSAGQFTTMITSGLAMRQYDRVALIDANLYGAVKSGTIDACLRVNGQDVRLARISAGDAESASCTKQVRIPAGQSPSILLGLRGGSAGGTATLSADARFNSLSVVAYPISMG